MALPYIASSGDGPVEAGSEDWKTILDFGPINYISVVNEGDAAGWWRLVDNSGSASSQVRLPAGGGEPGQRRVGFNIPCPGFSGKMQVKASVIGERLTGLYAHGMK